MRATRYALVLNAQPRGPKSHSDSQTCNTGTQTLFTDLVIDKKIRPMALCAGL